MTKFEEEFNYLIELLGKVLIGQVDAEAFEKNRIAFFEKYEIDQQQSLPVVPECVGNFLSGKSIFKIANGDIPDDVIPWVQEQTYYVDLEKIISHLIILKVTGFTVAVEKPQLFYIELPNVYGPNVYGLSDPVFVSKVESGTILEFTKGKDYALALTEQEIKSIDERYWQFAVPVEDGE